jgi:hypothetical protein
MRLQITFSAVSIAPVGFNQAESIQAAHGRSTST